MNWDKIEQLLNIMDKARHWPELRKLHDAARAELLELHSEREPDPKPPAEITSPIKRLGDDNG